MENFKLKLKAFFAGYTEMYQAQPAMVISNVLYSKE